MRQARRTRHATWSQSQPSVSFFDSSGDGQSSSSNSNSKEEGSDSDDDLDELAVQKAVSLPNLNRRLRRGDSDFQDGYPADGVQKVRSMSGDKEEARGYERKVDRRRSKTFKSITVPEEVLEEAGAHSIVEDDEDYSEDSEEDEAEVDEYGDSERPSRSCRSRRKAGQLSTQLTVDIHTDTVEANKEAKEETMKFFEPGRGAPAPKQHPTESGDRTPEMERQRAAAIEKVASAARKLKQKLQRQEQAMLSRRRKRHQSEPSPSMGQDARQAVAEAEAEAEAEQVEPLPAGGVPAVIIFDWDDTLFPTRHVTEVVKALHPKDGPLPSESPYHTDLKAHAQIVESILLSAREVVGRVSIVTLARRPWVENSAAWYLPGLDFEKLFQELEIEIFYAREHITRPHIYNAQLEEGVDMFVIAKRNAMLKCLRKLYGPSTKTMHVISVGDSTVEHLAAKEVLWCCPQEAGSYCKTIKLMSDPSVQNLAEELQVLASWLQQIVACEKDFDISFESEDFNDNITVTLAGAGPTGPSGSRT